LFDIIKQKNIFNFLTPMFSDKYRKKLKIAWIIIISLVVLSMLAFTVAPLLQF